MFRSVSPMLALVGALFLALAAHAQPSLVLTSHKAQYLVDEPLQLTIALANTGTTVIAPAAILDPAVWFLTLEIAPPGEEPFRYSPGFHADIMMPTVGVTLGPGESYSRRLWIARQAMGKSLLTRPGTYTLRARYQLPHDAPGGPLDLRAAAVTVAVRAPEGLELQAHDLLVNSGPDPWAYTAPALRDGRIAQCTEIVRDYPGSVYAPYACLRLADELAGRAELDERNTPAGVETRNQAMTRHRAFASLVRGTPLEARGLLEYARALARIGDVDTAPVYLESAFCCPTATTDERLEALSWTRLFEIGSFREGWTEHVPGMYPRPEVLYRLRPATAALGLAVEYDAKTRVVTITGPRVRATFTVGSDVITVNGTEYRDAKSSLNVAGQVRVSVRALGYLLMAQHGETLGFLVRPLRP